MSSPQMGDGAGAAVSGQTADLDAFVARHLRRNFAALAGDTCFFSLGVTFASLSTVLPSFAERLGASNLLIGLIPAVWTVFFTFPPLFAANVTERLARKLPFCLTYTTLERLPLLFLALGAYLLAGSRPDLVLALIFVALALQAGIGGALTPAWMDLIGKVIPTTYRGRMFAYATTASSLLGLGASAVIGYYLDRFAYPVDYALCFGTGFLCLVISYAALALTREPAVQSDLPHVGFREYARKLPEVLRRSRSFAWYLVSRLFGYFGMMANGFYTVYALKSLGAPDSVVAGFTFALLAGQTVANLAFGYVADHVGHKPVLAIGAAALVVGNAAALTSTSVEQLYFVFVCMAVFLAAGNVSAVNFMLEFAPPSERPTYVGLGSTLTAPISFLAPLVGGILADSAGYPVVFAVSGVAALASTGTLAVFVRDPRRSAAVTQ